MQVSFNYKRLVFYSFPFFSFSFTLTFSFSVCTLQTFNLSSITVSYEETKCGISFLFRAFLLSSISPPFYFPTFPLFTYTFLPLSIFSFLSHSPSIEFLQHKQLTSSREGDSIKGKKRNFQGEKGKAIIMQTYYMNTVYSIISKLAKHTYVQ